MKRWTVSVTIRRQVSIPPLPSTFTDIEWRSLLSIQTSQDNFTSSRPSWAHDSESWRLPSGLVWILDKDEMLTSNFVSVSSGTLVPPGIEAPRQQKPPSPRITVFLYARRCLPLRVFLYLLPLHDRKRNVPCPFGSALFWTHPNDLLQFGYLGLGAARTWDRCPLLLHDDHKVNSWIHSASFNDSETAANAIPDWSAVFDEPQAVIADEPNHFKTETSRLLSKGLRLTHHFTPPYFLWSNKWVERLGKELLRTARAVLSELQVGHDHWPQPFSVLSLRN